MENVSLAYKLSLYEEIKPIIEGKVYLVTNTIDGNIYIKKKLDIANKDMYIILRKYKNKHRVNIIDCFEYENNLIVIEEFISGKTLKSILEEKTFQDSEGVKIVSDICDGLIDLHDKNINIVHRDIKPDNIIISNDGIVKIIDFDASRITNGNKSMDTVVLGTREYASPEQFGFAETDERSDVYSLGVLLNYMLTREFPKNRICFGRLEDVIIKATAIDREDRYLSIKDFKEAINECGQSIFSSFNSKDLEKEDLDIDEDIDEDFEEDEEILETSKPSINNQKIESKGFTLRRIVGFRNLKVINMVVAGFWYITAAYGFFGEFLMGFKLDDLVLSLWMFIIPEVIMGNCFGLGNKIPWYNSMISKERKVARVIIVLGLSFVLGLFME